jgi:hypothetical protein
MTVTRYNKGDFPYESSAPSAVRADSYGEHKSKLNHKVSDCFVACSARALSLIGLPFPRSVGTTHATIGLFRALDWRPRKVDGCGLYRDMYDTSCAQASLHAHRVAHPEAVRQDAAQHGRVPRPADTGPVLSRLRGDRQSVSHLQSGCATPHAVLLASIRTPWSRALPRGPPRRHVCDPLRAGAREHAILHDLSPYPYM